MFGVAISTHRRPDVLRECLAAWGLVMPDVLVVNHDVEGEGVAATKNRGLAALMDAGCDELLLCDDDVWPMAEQAWRMFSQHPTDHLMLCWGQSRLADQTREHTIWKHPRGVGLFARRHVVERVGGMRTEFGRFGHEHVEWSRRIFNAGLTPAPFLGIPGQMRLWHAEDMGRPGETNADLGVRRRHLTTVKRDERNMSEAAAVLARYEKSSDFVEYRHAAHEDPC